jgi:hypothetical protein
VTFISTSKVSWSSQSNTTAGAATAAGVAANTVRTGTLKTAILPRKVEAKTTVKQDKLLLKNTLKKKIAEKG